MDNLTENLSSPYEDSSEDLLQPASAGKRFLNLLIDYIAFVIFLFLVCDIWAAVSPETFPGDESPASEIYLRIVAAILYLFFMTGIEYLCRGKSIGKMATGTISVMSDGSPLTLRAAFVRSLSRLAPFEAFSAFDNPPNPWHDKWSNTLVIDEKKSRL